MGGLQTAVSATVGQNRDLKVGNLAPEDSLPAPGSERAPRNPASPTATLRVRQPWAAT